MYYLAILAALLFAVYYLFNQMYQRICGDGLEATALSGAIGSVISMIYMFVLGGFQIEFTPFSVLMAFLFSINNFASLYCGLKAFKTADLSLYSIFLTLGGMLIPFIYGVTLAKEGITVLKVLCILFIVLSLAFTYEKGHSSPKAYIYYFSIFVLNGTVSVLEAIHQSSVAPTVNSTSFVAITSMFSFVGCLLIILVRKKKIPRVTPKVFGIISASVACSAVASLLSLVAVKVVPASVHFSIITGGVMVFSTLISLLRKEKLTAKAFISTGFALAATILIML